MNPVTKRLLITVLKYVISFSIIGYLCWRTWHDDPESFVALRDQPKNWWLLAAALGMCLAAVLGTIIRWYVLVRAIHIPFTMSEAMRLGFVGYLFNFLTLGVVGGDLVKAIFLAKRQPSKKTEAVATVVIDRIIGLYALFVVASIAIFCTDLGSATARDPIRLAAVKTVCWATIALTVLGTLGFAAVALPNFGKGPFWQKLMKAKKVGPVVERITTALLIYRARPGLMTVIAIMSLAIHAMFVFSVYFIALGLPGDVPSLATHFVIVPLATVAGTVPLPGGLGAYETALSFLYAAVTSAGVPESQGLVIALCFRVITVIIAIIGAAYYLLSRAELSGIVAEAEREELSGDPDARTLDLTPGVPFE